MYDDVVICLICLNCLASMLTLLLTSYLHLDIPLSSSASSLCSNIYIYTINTCVGINGCSFIYTADMSVNISLCPSIQIIPKLLHSPPSSSPSELSVSGATMASKYSTCASTSSRAGSLAAVVAFAFLSPDFNCLR